MPSNVLSHLLSKSLCLNILIILNILSINTSYHHNQAQISILLPIIATSHNVICKAFNQHFPIFLLVAILVLASLPNARCINLTNQIRYIKAINNLTKNAYIKSMIKNLIFIQKVFIEPQNKKPKKFNSCIKTLTKLIQILLGLKLYVKNVEIRFPQNPNFTSTRKTAALRLFSFYYLIPLSQPCLSLLSL